jgi:hypothetical protein
MTTTQCPYETPAVGTMVRIKCGDDVTCPYAERLSAEALTGWADFFAGRTKPESAEAAKGWTFASNHKLIREGYVWTFTGTEKTEEGWFAVISRTEPRCLDDVYNGTGTGLGTDTFVEKIKLGE